MQAALAAEKPTAGILHAAMQHIIKRNAEKLLEVKLSEAEVPLLLNLISSFSSLNVSS